MYSAFKFYVPKAFEIIRLTLILRVPNVFFSFFSRNVMLWSFLIVMIYVYNYAKKFGLLSDRTEAAARFSD